ncbi:MAG: DMT family transporter [Ferruginibacter sp.]
MKKAFIQLHIAVFLAGFTAVLGKLITLNEGLLVWYRLLITVFVLAVILFFRKEFKRYPFRDIIRMAGVGGVIAFHWVTFYGSVKYGNISVALVCLSSAGFFSALLEPLFLKKKIIIPELLLGLMAIAGIYIIFDFHPQFKLGIVYGMLSAFGAAVFPILNKELLHRFSPRTLTFYELGGGLVILTLLLPFYLDQTGAAYYIPTLSDLGWLLVLALLCTVVSFDLQLQALQKISAFTVNLMYNLEPLYGIILAFVFFGEGKMFHDEFYWGVALIVMAIVIQMYRVGRAAVSRKAAEETQRGFTQSREGNAKSQ